MVRLKSDLPLKMKELQLALSNVTPKMAKAAFKASAKLALDHLEGTLAAGSSPYGKPWADKADGTKVKSWAESAKTTHLEELSVNVGVPKPYAIFHERGAKGAQIGPMPRKQAMKLLMIGKRVTLRTPNGKPSNWVLPKRQALFWKTFPKKLSDSMKAIIFQVLGKSCADVIARVKTIKSL